MYLLHGRDYFLIKTRAPVENQFNFVHFIHFLEMPPPPPPPPTGICNPSVGGIWILSSKAKLCCFCQILCRISTLHIINETSQTASMKKSYYLCWQDHSVFIPVYVYSRFYLIFYPCLCFPNIELQ